MGLDEFDFLLVQSVLGIELPINVRNGLGPVNVGVRGEVLEGNTPPFICCIILSNFQNTEQNTSKFRFNVL